jgi:hypothetical protein
MNASEFEQRLFLKAAERQAIMKSAGGYYNLSVREEYERLLTEWKLILETEKKDPPKSWYHVYNEKEKF